MRVNPCQSGILTQPLPHPRPPTPGPPPPALQVHLGPLTLYAVRTLRHISKCYSPNSCIPSALPPQVRVGPLTPCAVHTLRHAHSAPHQQAFLTF